MTPRPDVDPTYERILTLVRTAIRVSGRTQFELEPLIGRRRGYLSHVFMGRVQLKLIDLLALVRVLGLDPAAVFGDLIVGAAGAPRERPEPVERPAPEARPDELLADAERRE